MVRETQALSASARQLTPQADERGIRLVLPAGIRPRDRDNFSTGPARHCLGAGAAPTGPAALPSRSPPRRRRPGARRTSPSRAPSRSCCPTARAAAPADAPPQVQQAIWAANKIQDKPYIYGGGHRKFEDKGYDCSGTVSYALNGGGLLDSPLDSGSFMKLGRDGRGHVDHGLHEPRPRLRRDRRSAPGHQRRLGHAREHAPVQEGARARPALAPDAALRARLQGAPPGRFLEPPLGATRPSRLRRYAWSDPTSLTTQEGRCRGRHVRAVLHCNQGQDQPDARQGRGSG